MSLPQVAIVIVNWNAWQTTVACLRSLRRITYPRAEIILVDNGSNHEDRYRLQEHLAGVTFIRNLHNVGFSGGYNAGIRRALHDPHIAYLLVLNNDVIVEPEFLTEMVHTAQIHEADMVAPVALRLEDRRTVDRLGLVLSRSLLGYNMRRWEGRQPFCPSGCCALYSRRLLENISVGGEYFDEDFFAYTEDLELGIRAVLMGYRAALAPRAIIYHQGSASTSEDSVLAYYLRHRNTLWYLIKSIPALTLLRHMHWVLAGQLFGILHGIIRKRGALVLRAKWDSLRGIRAMLRKRKAIFSRTPRATTRLEGLLDARPFYLRIGPGLVGVDRPSQH